jgi:hypothetical protein
MENLIIKRRENIIKYLISYLPKDVSNLISLYDYYLEGKSYALTEDAKPAFAIVELHNGKIVCKSDISSSVIKIWNLQTGLCDISFGEKTQKIRSIATFNDRLITGSIEGTIKIWNTSTGLCDITFPEKSSWIVKIGVIPDSPYRIITCSLFGELKIWNTQTGTSDTIISNHTKFYGVLSDGRIIITTKINEYYLLSVYNLKNKNHDIKLKLDFSQQINDIFIHSDNLIILLMNEVSTHNNNYKIKVWNIHTEEYDTTFTFSKIESEGKLSAALLPDGRIIRTCGVNKNKLTILNLRTGKYDIHFTNDHTDSINQIIALRDGRIISCSYDGTIRVWS